MKVRTITLSLLIMCGILYPIFAAAVDPEQLFESKCSQCHPSDRPKGVRKAPIEWTDTVMRMKDVNGCKITDEEAKIIIQYLSEKYHLPL